MDVFWILKAYSFAFSEKSYNQYEYGDKVCMPNSVLERISHISSDLVLSANPLLFSVMSVENEKKVCEEEKKVQEEYARRYRDIWEDQLIKSRSAIMKKKLKKFLGKEHMEHLLKTYKGKEHELYLKMCERYCIEEGSRLPPFPLKTGTETMNLMYCSVLEFEAPDATVYLPHWFMRNLGLKEGTYVNVRQAKVPKAEFLELQPQANGFNNMLERYGSKELLESCLRKYSVLTEGQVFDVEWRGRPWSIRVLSAKPKKTVGLVDSDPKVDLTPLPFDETDSKELERLAEEPEMNGDLVRHESFSKFNAIEQEQMALAMKQSLAEEADVRSDDDDKPLTELCIPSGKGTLCPHCSNYIERNFEMHEIHCRRRGAKHKCKWCGAFKSLQHEKDCGNEEHKCSGCGAMVAKRLLPKHECPVSCDMCGRKVLPSEVDLHMLTDCPKRQTFCRYCQLPVLFSELKSHMDYCGSRTEPCALCNQAVAKSKMDEHLCPMIYPNLVSEVPSGPGKPQMSKPFIPALPQSWGTDWSNGTEQKTPEVDFPLQFMAAPEAFMQAPNDPFFCPHCSKDFFDFNSLQRHLDGDDCIILKARATRKKSLKSSRSRQRKPASRQKHLKSSSTRQRKPDCKEKEFDKLVKEKFDKWACPCGWMNGRAKLRCMKCHERRPSI